MLNVWAKLAAVALVIVVQTAFVLALLAGAVWVIVWVLRSLGVIG
jgi:hypothetical protein